MKLKHNITRIMLTIYLVSMAGLAFNMHYCHGKLASVSLYAPAKPCKMCAGLVNKNIDDGCCKTELLEVKVSDDHQASFKINFQKAVYEFLLPDWAITSFVNPLIHQPNAVLTVNTAPRVPPNDIYVVNCIFRI